MFYPKSPSFTLLDSFLAYKSSRDKVDVYGVKVSKGQAPPPSDTTAEQDTPDWTSSVTLVSGDASDEVSYDSFTSTTKDSDTATTASRGRRGRSSK